MLVPSEVGAPDCGPPLFGPVHLACTHIQRDTAWGGQSVGYEVFDVGAIQIGTLNRAHSPVGPIHLARPRIQSDVLREAQSAGHEVFDFGVIQVDRADGNGADPGHRLVAQGGPVLGWGERWRPGERIVRSRCGGGRGDARDKRTEDKDPHHCHDGCSHGLSSSVE